MLRCTGSDFTHEPFGVTLLIVQFPNGSAIGVGAELFRANPSIGFLVLTQRYAELRLGTCVRLKQISGPLLESAHTLHGSAEVARGSQQRLAYITFACGELASAF